MIDDGEGMVCITQGRELYYLYHVLYLQTLNLNDILKYKELFNAYLQVVRGRAEERIRKRQLTLMISEKLYGNLLSHKLPEIHIYILIKYTYTHVKNN